MVELMGQNSYSSGMESYDINYVVKLSVTQLMNMIGFD